MEHGRPVAMSAGLPVLMRVHRKGGPTLIELASQMPHKVHQWLPEHSFRVCADGFYASLAGAKIPGKHLASHYSGRWSIEKTFKQTRQILGGQQVQSWKRHHQQHDTT